MLDLWNHQLFTALVAPDDLAGLSLLVPLALAQATVYLAPCVLVLIWLFGDAEERRSAVSAGTAALLALLIAAVISKAFAHPRPFVDSSARNYLDHAPDSSFPSDHAVLIFAVGISLLLGVSKVSRVLGLGMTLMALVTGWARIFLGAHYPFDVVGSAMVAVVCSLVVHLPVMRRISAHVVTWGELLKMHFR